MQRGKKLFWFVLVAFTISIFMISTPAQADKWRNGLQKQKRPLA
jgi:hypothetical protein